MIVYSNPKESKQRHSALLSSARTRDAAFALLPQLEKIDRDVVTLRYGLDGSRPSTVQQAGTALGVSMAVVRYHEQQGIARMVELGLDLDPFAKFRK